MIRDFAKVLQLEKKYKNGEYLTEISKDKDYICHTIFRVKKFEVNPLAELGCAAQHYCAIQIFTTSKNGIHFSKLESGYAIAMASHCKLRKSTKDEIKLLLSLR